MLPYNELIELRGRLANGEISLELANEIIGKIIKKGNGLGTQKIGKKEDVKFLKKNAKYAAVRISTYFTIKHLH